MMMLVAASQVIQLLIDELDCRCSKSEGILEVKNLSVETGSNRITGRASIRWGNGCEAM